VMQWPPAPASLIHLAHATLEQEVESPRVISPHSLVHAVLRPTSMRPQQCDGKQVRAALVESLLHLLLWTARCLETWGCSLRPLR